MSNYKPTVSFEDREHLEQAFHAGQLDHEHLYRVLNIDTYYRLGPDSKGFIEVNDPNDEQNANIFIWWLDRYHTMATFFQIEKCATGENTHPALPGHLQMAVNSIHRNTVYDGHLIVPMPLRNIVDPEHVDDVVDSQSLKALLYSKFVGIPFEMVHYDKVKHYAGLITTMDLSVPDLCAMREELAKEESL